MDLLIVWPWPEGAPETRKYVMERKILRGGLEKTVRDGVLQTKAYIPDYSQVARIRLAGVAQVVGIVCEYCCEVASFPHPWSSSPPCRTIHCVCQGCHHRRYVFNHPPSRFDLSRFQGGIEVDPFLPNCTLIGYMLPCADVRYGIIRKVNDSHTFRFVDYSPCLKQEI